MKWWCDRNLSWMCADRAVVLGSDQSAMDAVQQGQEAIAHRHRAGQDALRSEFAAAPRRQAQGKVQFWIFLQFTSSLRTIYFCWFDWGKKKAKEMRVKWCGWSDKGGWLMGHATRTTQSSNATRTARLGTWSRWGSTIWDSIGFELNRLLVERATHTHTHTQNARFKIRSINNVPSGLDQLGEIPGRNVVPKDAYGLEMFPLLTCH